MNIQTKNHSENQVIISAENLKKLVEIAEKVEPVEIIEEISEEQIEVREEIFARELLAEGFISKIPSRTMTDEEFDEFELLEIKGELLSETVLRLRD